MRVMRPVNDGVLEKNLIQWPAIGVVMGVLDSQTSKFRGVELEQRCFGAWRAPKTVECAAHQRYAEAPGLDVPATLLALADEVIE